MIQSIHRLQLESRIREALEDFQQGSDRLKPLSASQENYPQYMAHYLPVYGKLLTALALLDLYNASFPDSPFQASAQAIEEQRKIQEKVLTEIIRSAFHKAV